MDLCARLAVAAFAAKAERKPATGQVVLPRLIVRASTGGE